MSTGTGLREALHLELKGDSVGVWIELKSHLRVLHALICSVIDPIPLFLLFLSL